MEALRNYLLSEKNLLMIETITLDKIYQLTGITVEKDLDFKNNIFIVATAVIRVEVQKDIKFNNTIVLKINNIIIAESVKYIISTLNFESLSSKIEDLTEEDTDFFEELKKDKKEEIKELKPEFEEQILIFDKEETNINLKNVISAELVCFSVDFSDYIINENNNCLKINDTIIEVPVGNYSPNELIEYLNDVTDPEILFTLDKKTEIIEIDCMQKASSFASVKNKSIIVDFDIKNSMYYILAVLKQSYNLKEKKIVGQMKHKINHPSFIDIEIFYTENHLEKHRILTNVNYNNTIHYYPKISKKVVLNQQNVDNIKLKMNYNTRGRPYTFSIKFVNVLI